MPEEKKGKELTVRVKLTEQPEFEKLLTNLSDMLKDERIPLEVREEYKNKTFEIFDYEPG